MMNSSSKETDYSFVISNLRSDLRLTREEFGVLFEVNKQSIYGWETKRQSPSRLHLLVFYAIWDKWNNTSEYRKEFREICESKLRKDSTLKEILEFAFRAEK